MAQQTVRRPIWRAVAGQRRRAASASIRRTSRHEVLVDMAAQGEPGEPGIGEFSRLRWVADAAAQALSIEPATTRAPPRQLAAPYPREDQGLRAL